MTQIESDKAIAYFLGWRIDNSFPDKGKVWRKGSYLEMETTFKFSKDWNELMEAVVLIEKLGYNFIVHQASILIERNDVGLQKGLEDCNIGIRSSMVEFNKKLAIYSAVSKFAIWYNALQIGKK